MKKTKVLAVCIVLALAGAATAVAEVHIQLHSMPLAELARPQHVSVVDPSQPSATRPAGEAKVERPSTFYILGHFKIDSTNPFGETTFITIRNEGQADEVPSVLLHPLNSISIQDDISVGTLAPRQVVPINLSAHATAAPDGDGFIRGWARIRSTGPISVDFFQVNTSQDFAAAGTLIDIDGDEFCYITRSRFLTGGGFSGGTEITFMQDFPLGGDQMTDPPSIEGEAYDEAGNFINSFTIHTDQYSFQRQASELVLPGNIGGVLEITFKNAETGFDGGFSRSELKANDKFSVNLKGVCLQQAEVIN